ncbi:phage scaffolding protein [Salipaludibacillus agaradhaerens]|uniref:phage scaffolding protein n=1 Tax=Salipaludibacillus TaxID=1884449 RepID=UPI0020D09A93|nr:MULTISPECIES: phage scaffolding protein [Salipaludibacillus]MCR6116642.1 phage scaffolding protein [Salipaludibacillus agaradhaerens]UTR13480.1 phage scaffolding protein [Salipaludibacillus sp. LMS25]
MNREELKSLGLTDEQIDKVMASHGKTLNETKEKADKVDGLESQIEDYKQQIADRDTQLEELGEKAKGNEELTSQIEELKQQNETTKTEYEQKLEQQAFDHAIEKALGSTNPKKGKDDDVSHSLKAIKSLLDMDTIKMDGDTLKGFDDQLKTIKETSPFLFESEESQQSPQIVTPGNPDGGSNSNDDPFAAKLAKYTN